MHCWHLSLDFQTVATLWKISKMHIRFIGWRFTYSTYASYCDVWNQRNQSFLTHKIFNNDDEATTTTKIATTSKTETITKNGEKTNSKRIIAHIFTCLKQYEPRRADCVVMHDERRLWIFLDLKKKAWVYVCVCVCNVHEPNAIKEEYDLLEAAQENPSKYHKWHRTAHICKTKQYGKIQSSVRCTFGPFPSASVVDSTWKNSCNCSKNRIKEKKNL